VVYYMFIGEDGYGWRLVAANNRVIARSTESDHNERDCLWSINLVKGSGPAPGYKV
jgi:uncharacterized protein YegP (UPF0339 family)